MRDRTRVAIEVGDYATGLTDQQEPGGDVPGRQGHFPEGLEASASDVSEIESSRARTPNAGRIVHDPGKHLEIPLRVWIPGFEGEACSDERSGRINDLRDGDWLAGASRTAAGR